jgi:hypothetical protein
MHDRRDLGRRVRVLPTADSEQGRLHAGEGGTIEEQFGTVQEGLRGYHVLLESGKSIFLNPDEVELLGY